MMKKDDLKQRLLLWPQFPFKVDYIPLMCGTMLYKIENWPVKEYIVIWLIGNDGSIVKLMYNVDIEDRISAMELRNKL